MFEIRRSPCSCTDPARISVRLPHAADGRPRGIGGRREDRRPLRPFTDAGLELGYCARPREVDVRLAARGPDAAGRVRAAEAVVLELLGGHVFGRDDEELETVVVRFLTEQRKTLALRNPAPAAASPTASRTCPAPRPCC